MRLIALLLGLGLTAAACGTSQAESEPPTQTTTWATGPASAVSPTPDRPIALGSRHTIPRLDPSTAIDTPDYESAASADWLALDDLVVGFVDANGSA